MTLPEFISDIGDEAASALFEVPERTIASWRRRDRYPRRTQAVLIVERTFGRVDYEGIYAPAPPSDVSAA
jgi:hypothetical protein